MADLPDEKLMAYADGALEPAERARIGATLAQSAELRGRLAAFEATGTVLGALFEKPMHEPVPRHLVDLVLNGTVANFQRKSGDTWPIISALMEGHYHALHLQSTPERIAFWLREARTPERLRDLAVRFPGEARAMQVARPLLACAITGDMDPLRAALDAEVRAEQARDRTYWEPLKREMEQFRREERGGGQ